MATKKRSSKPAPASSTQPLARLQTSMRNLQHDAEKLLQRTRRQATAVITRDQQKALDRIINQAQKMRKDFEQRARRAGKEIESRTEKFMRAIEKETTTRLSKVLERLDVPSRSEVQGLTRRLNELEKKMKSRALPRRAKPRSASPARKPSPPKSPSA